MNLKKTYTHNYSEIANLLIWKELLKLLRDLTLRFDSILNYFFCFFFFVIVSEAGPLVIRIFFSLHLAQKADVFSKQTISHLFFWSLLHLFLIINMLFASENEFTFSSCLFILLLLKFQPICFLSYKNWNEILPHTFL